MALNTNLVSYWKLDESSGNAADSVGSNTLTNVNSVTYSSGKINNGAVFNAATKSLSIASALGVGANNAKSFSFWIKMGTDISSGSILLQQQNNTVFGTSTGFYYEYNGGTRRLQYFKYDPSPGPVNHLIYYNITLGTTWHHVVGTTDSSNLKLYVDGNYVGTVADFTASIDGTYNDSFQLGGTGTIDNYTFDEVGIWSRALTSTEITSLYNSGSGLAYPFSTDITLTAVTGSFALTGYASAFTMGMTMIASVGNFMLTGYDAILRFGGTIWTNQSKNTSTFTNQTKNNSNWTNQIKS